MDLYPTRRGNLFADEVYRLEKANDATSCYPRTTGEEEKSEHKYFPPNHKFSSNDVILLTLQPRGSGDFFDPTALPISDTAIKVEGRVLNIGPTYIDVAVQAGIFQGAFGPAPNDSSGQGDPSMRLRADRFFSSIPYQRMVDAITQIASVPERKKDDTKPKTQHENISMDEVLREVILATHAFGDTHSPMLRDPTVCDLQELVRLDY